MDGWVHGKDAGLMALEWIEGWNYGFRAITVPTRLSDYIHLP